MPKAYFKACVMCLLVMFSYHFVSAQRIYGYLQTGGGWGNFNTVNIGATFIYHNWGLTYDYVRQAKDVENVPPDEQPLVPIWGGSVKQTLHGSCIEAVRIGYIPESRFRFVARAGVFIGGHTFPKFTLSPQPPSWGILNFGPNYDVNWQTDRVAGFIVHPGIEWAAGRVFGLSSGIRITIAGEYNTVAIDFNMLLGKVGDAHKRKRHIAETGVSPTE